MNELQRQEKEKWQDTIPEAVFVGVCVLVVNSCWKNQKIFIGEHKKFDIIKTNLSVVSPAVTLSRVPVVSSSRGT